MTFRDAIAALPPGSSVTLAREELLKLLGPGDGDTVLITTTQATVDMLKKHGFTPVFKESPGGHTWINWRNYLHEFVPQLFQ